MRNGKNGWRTLYHRNFNEQHLDCYFTIFIRHDLLQQHLTCIQKTGHGLILIFFDKSSLISTGWFDGVLRTSMARLVSVVSLRGLAVQSSSSQSDPVCKTVFFSLRLPSVRLFIQCQSLSLWFPTSEWCGCLSLLLHLVLQSAPSHFLQHPGRFSREQTDTAAPTDPANAPEIYWNCADNRKT